MEEVHRRHRSDADRATDDLIHSRAEIEKLQGCLPDLSERHKFYQDLRGYVTDLVECFDEKVGPTPTHILYTVAPRAVMMIVSVVPTVRISILYSIVYYILQSFYKRFRANLRTGGTYIPSIGHSCSLHCIKRVFLPEDRQR